LSRVKNELYSKKILNSLYIRGIQGVINLVLSTPWLRKENRTQMSKHFSKRFIMAH